MNKTKVLIAVSVLMAFGAVSCKKETTDPVEKKDPTAMDRITAHDWILKDRTMDGASIWSNYEDCYKDNVYTFGKDSSYHMGESTLPCNPPNELTQMFRISVAQDSLFLFAFVGSQETNYKILQLTDTKLEVQYSLPDHDYTWYYEKK